MKIEIITKGKTIETLNYVLSTAVDELKKDAIREKMDLQVSDVNDLETFRRQLLKSYFRQFPKTTKTGKG